MRTVGDWCIDAALLVSAIVHLTPATGLIGGEAVLRLYGVAIADGNMDLLLRHRALMFALIGTPMLLAAISGQWRGAAILLALINTVGFVVLAWPGTNLTPELQRVMRIDAALILPLLIAGAIWLRSVSR